MDGVVQIYKNHTWNFVNGSEWDFGDAMVVCRELGMFDMKQSLASTCNVDYNQLLDHNNVYKIIFIIPCRL